MTFFCCRLRIAPPRTRIEIPNGLHIYDSPLRRFTYSPIRVFAFSVFRSRPFTFQTRATHVPVLEQQVFPVLLPSVFPASQHVSHSN